jgi:serine/threonine protein kinase
VAIKAMAPPLAASGAGRQRFVREAQAAAAVNHDNVIDIYAVEEAGPVPYLAMEYVAGISLEEKLKQQGPLELKEILRIGLQTADGLAAAHRQGLVHHDVKLANILLENGVGRVKITDFGLARAADDVSVTQTGVIAGTPSYMSPEQARGDGRSPQRPVQPGSVLYALCRPDAVSQQHAAGRAQAGLRGAAAADPRPESRYPRVALCDH